MAALEPGPAAALGAGLEHGAKPVSAPPVSSPSLEHSSSRGILGERPGQAPAIARGQGRRSESRSRSESALASSSALPRPRTRRLRPLPRAAPDLRCACTADADACAKTLLMVKRASPDGFDIESGDESRTGGSELPRPWARVQQKKSRARATGKQASLRPRPQPLAPVAHALELAGLRGSAVFLFMSQHVAAAGM